MDTIHLRVRDGQVEDAGSWLYVWVRAGGEVVHVGGTGLAPQVRTWLHLHHDDPAVGRVAARHPGAATEALDVHACRIPDGVDRAAARAELVARLAARGRLGAAYVGEPPEPVDSPDEVRRVVDEVEQELRDVLGA
ncbi:hypothetical protein SAMN04488570_2618 [Nocardioides scoriae]|uniref:GIY-YIG domain-containing protein n=1 Tax=Nocardioides scoriae TaxID=642780 RepID=A0A1H1UTQ3_9ACTN|nr:hypothetical protein [Nocardioides scoriae]SDS75700.1 hypothetical protein SAMN04488570_2618 [Nocardioides scoriae]